MIKNQIKYIHHFFYDIPLSVILNRHPTLKNMTKFYDFERESYKSGIQYLFPNIDHSLLEAYLTQALAYKIAKEQETFRYLGKNKNIKTKIIGLEEIQKLTTNKPLILLTGHYGSFYTLAPILNQYQSLKIYPIARTVDKSVNNPIGQQLFEQFNYWITEKNLNGHYLYTDFNGWIDKKIIDVFKQKQIILLLIDLPKRLFPKNRHPVKFLHEKNSSLPSRLVELAYKRKAHFLTAWHQFSNDFQEKSLIIEKAIEYETIDDILQTYANRLNNKIIESPWQWLGLPIVQQYLE